MRAKGKSAQEATASPTKKKAASPKATAKDITPLMAFESTASNFFYPDHLNASQPSSRHRKNG